MRTIDRKLVLEDGSEYYGYGFGSRADRVCEIVFNTSMSGYQEIVSDLSYTDQMVVMTYPLIGNYGMAEDDYECKFPSIGGIVCYDYNDTPSNFRWVKTLSELLEEYGIPGISGIDTRKLTRSIRDLGSRRVLITSAETGVEEALRRIADTPVPKDAVSRVSCKKRWYSRTADARYNVVAIDCGMKLNIVRSLNDCGCNVTIVPYNTPVEDTIAALLEYVSCNTHTFQRRRQADGIAAAKARGVKFGRPRRKRPKDFEKVKEQWKSGLLSSRTAAKELGVSQSSFVRWAKEEQ